MNLKRFLVGAVSNLKNSLGGTLYNDKENSDEEWLKEKNRILDGRIKYSKLMETINNENTHLPVV